MSRAIDQFFRFGDFTVDTDQKILLRQGKPLPLTPKVFDTLLVLIENRRPDR
jgi:DNA-binding winged helix-turn-helix (wHTH) protein